MIEIKGLESRDSGCGHFDGSLIIKEEGGSYYWIIHNLDIDLLDLSNWSAIPENLFIELLKERRVYY
jgi:hypothetical protein